MKKHRIILGVLTALVILALSAPVLLHYPSTGSAAWFCVNLFIALFVLRWPAMVVHELGHALVARATGLQVIAIVIGVGRPLVNFRIGPTRVAICSRSAMGLTHIAAPPGLERAAGRVVITTAAGPMLNLGLFLVIGLVTGVPGWGIDSPRWTSQIALIEAVQWANLFTAIIALIPVRIASPIGMMFSDGYAIISGLRKPQVLKQRLAETYYMSKAYEPLRVGDVQSAVESYEEGLSRYPDSFLLKHCRAVTAVQSGYFTIARERLLKLVGTPEEQEYSAAAFNKNAIAYADAMLGDPALLDEADRLSREALAEGPKVAAFQGTRGAVLVQMGQVEAGRQFLLGAYKQHSEPVMRSATAAWIATAYARAGDFVEGRRWLERAEQQCLEGPELFLASRELEEKPQREHAAAEMQAVTA